MIVQLFCYANPACRIDRCVAASNTRYLHRPEGVASANLTRGSAACGIRVRFCIRGNLPLARVRRRTEDYDRLLGVRPEFVRGEASFVREQWAARPVNGTAIPMAKTRIWPKLDAFPRERRGLCPTSPHCLGRIRTNDVE